MSSLDTLKKHPAEQPAGPLAWPDAGGEPAAGMAVPSLADRRGKRTAQTIEALARRDAILREIRRRFFAGYSARSAAVEIEKVLRRFEASSWVRERAEDRCPQRHVGRIGELLWSLLRARDCVPSSALIRLVISRE